jgi:hypothetical protein
MGSNLSRPLDYTCHELGHTWSPSCTYSAIEVMCHTFEESIKIYSTVYFASTLIKRQRPSLRQVKALIANILRSTIFLSYNAFAFVVAICTTRYNCSMPTKSLPSILAGSENSLASSTITPWASLTPSWVA